MKKTVTHTLILLAGLLALGSCASTRRASSTRHVYWKIDTLLFTDIKGNPLPTAKDLWAPVVARVYAHRECRPGPAPSSDRPENVIELIMAREAGEPQFKGGLDTLRFEVRLDEQGRGHWEFVLAKLYGWEP
jgi:hypothetical protein